MKAEDRHLTPYNKGALDALINTYLFDTEYYHSEGDTEGARSLSKTKEEIMAGLRQLLREDLLALYEKYAGQNREMEDEINWREKRGKTKDVNKEKVQKALSEIVNAMQTILAADVEIGLSEPNIPAQEQITEVIPLPAAPPQGNAGSQWQAILEEEWQPQLLEEEWESEPVITLPDSPIITQGQTITEVDPDPGPRIPEVQDDQIAIKPAKPRTTKFHSASKQKATATPSYSTSNADFDNHATSDDPPYLAPESPTPVAKLSARKPKSKPPTPVAKSLTSKPKPSTPKSKPPAPKSKPPAQVVKSSPPKPKSPPPKPKPPTPQAKSLTPKPKSLKPQSKPIAPKPSPAKPINDRKRASKKSTVAVGKTSQTTGKKSKKAKKQKKAPAASPQPQPPVNAQQERIHMLIKDYLEQRPKVDRKERERYEEKMRMERYERERQKRQQKEQRIRSKSRKATKPKSAGEEKQRVNTAPAKKKKSWWS